MDIILKESGFGEYNKQMVETLINYISNTLSKASAIESMKTVVICHGSDDVPMCSILGNTHIISLVVQENYWCQWVYQYSHEFCHHLIDGKMTGDLKGMKWFEECLCHTASMFCLAELSDQELWCQWGYPSYALAVCQYLDQMLNKVNDMRQDYYRYNKIQHKGICLWLSELSQEGVDYPRTHYNAVASIMLQTFLQNKHLWEILQHIGDSESWRSLEELLSHLQLKATPMYEAALKELRGLLLGGD